MITQINNCTQIDEATSINRSKALINVEPNVHTDSYSSTRHEIQFWCYTIYFEIQNFTFSMPLQNCAVSHQTCM